MKCIHCGSELMPDARFCSNCGAPVTRLENTVSAPDTAGSSPNQPYASQPGYPQGPTPQKKSNKAVWGIVLGIVALVVVLLVVIVVLLLGNKTSEVPSSADTTTGNISSQEPDDDTSGLSGEMETFRMGSVTFTVPREWNWEENEYGYITLVPSADELIAIYCFADEGRYLSDDDYLKSTEQDYDGYRYISFEEASFGGISGKLHTYNATFDLDYKVSSFYFAIGDDLMNVLYMRSVSLPDSRQPLEEVMGSMQMFEDADTENTAPSSPGSDSVPVQDSYGDGTYEVGVDIPAGEYVLLPDAEESGSYAVRSSAEQDTTDNLIDYDTTSQRDYLTVEEGQYLTIRSCVVIPSDKAPAVDISSGVIPHGTYKVGKDIPAGEYTLRCYSNSRGMFTVRNSSQITDKDSTVVMSGTFDDVASVTVEEGQYLSVGGAEIYLP